MKMSDSSEIFQDCNDREVRQKTIASDDKKLTENYNESGVEKNNNNNNHHVVPVGIIILLMTIYLGMTSVQKSLVSCVEENTLKEQPKQSTQGILVDLYKPINKENSIILERLLEYKDICKDLEIFTRNINLRTENVENQATTYEIVKQFMVNREEKTNGEDGRSIYTGNNNAIGPSGSESCAKETHNNIKPKYTIKSSSNAKNGFNKYNKSSKAKYNKNNNKKELNLNKKSSTAEPIIYLFALIFIYLLLKAASDINQHYKTQNKTDKRLRRCSLQSYAQTHRPDRRSSKGISAKSLPKF